MTGKFFIIKCHGEPKIKKLTSHGFQRTKNQKTYLSHVSKEPKIKNNHQSCFQRTKNQVNISKHNKNRYAEQSVKS
jgi:hypothetical protein